MTDLSVVVFSFARNYIDYVKLPMGAKKKKMQWIWMNEHSGIYGPKLIIRVSALTLNTTINN